MVDAPTFGARIRVLRLAKQLSQRDLAEQVAARFKEQDNLLVDSDAYFFLIYVLKRVILPYGGVYSNQTTGSVMVLADLEIARTVQSVMLGESLTDPKVTQSVKSDGRSQLKQERPTTQVIGPKWFVQF